MTEFQNLCINIKTWSDIADKASPININDVFEQNGNSFPLTLNAKLKSCDRLHVYFTTNASHQINFFIIPANLDNEEIPNGYKAGLYPIMLQPNAQVIPNPNRNELVTWINNWCDDGMRNNWLNNINQAPQVLVIRTSDFTVNELHACYLALKPNTNPSIPSKYALDLVIENTVTGNFINVDVSTADTEIGSQFADMARPVPPFGQENRPSTDENNFGILEYMSIQ